MPKKRPTVEPELAKDTPRHFLRHREAADTLEGVARRHLLDEKIHHTVDETAEALDWLVKEDSLEQAASAVSGSLFRVNWNKIADAERFLEKKEGERKQVRRPLEKDWIVVDRSGADL